MAGRHEDGGFGVLGDASRRAVFELLARGPASVGELAELLPISRPAVSQHLKVLKKGRLVIAHAEGTRRVYRINPRGIKALRSYLDRLWIDALVAAQNAKDGTRWRSGRSQPH